MKASVRRILSLVIIIAVFVANVHLVDAAEPEIMPRASAYFSRIDWDLTPIGNGDLQVFTAVYATDVMTKLGASSVAIYEKLPGATSFTMVHVFNRYNSPDALGTNKYTYVYEPVYTKGVAGAQYYASIAFYAENSAGSETLYRTTLIVTAT